MHDDKLPADPAGGDPRLPVQSAAGANAIAPAQPGVLALDLFREERRENEDEIDLRQYWRIIVKHRWTVAGVLGVVVAIALLVTLMATPIFRATTVLQLDKDDQSLIQIGGAELPTGNDPQFLQTQYELLKSRSLAERVADDLRLDAARIERLQSPGWGERVRELLQPQTREQKAEGAGQRSTDAVRREATNVVARGITVEPVRNSRLVKVHFDSPDPRFSAEAANALAEGFIAEGLERRFGASDYAKKYLQDQLAVTKSRLEQSERALVEFAQKEGLVNTTEGQSLTGQNLTELNATLATAQEQRIRAQARWQQAQAAQGAALPADMLNNSILRTLQQQRAELQAQYQQKLGVFKPDYPEMVQLRGQIEDLNRQIGQELSNIRASVRAEYNAALAQERMLQGQLASLRSQTLDVDNRSIQYNILKREVDTNRELYNGLLQRFKEVGVAGDVRSNNISVIDAAQPPLSRFKPNVKLNLAIGLLLGLMLGVLTAFVREFLDDTIKTPDDIEQRLRLPVLGVIPKLVKQTPAEAAADLRSAFSEAYRSVRTALQFSTEKGVPKVLLVTSSSPGEGKSTTALALARNFAQLGKRVLLIEADLRKPSLHKTLEVRSETGLSALLAGATTLPEVIVTTSDERLDVILAGPLPPNPAELLSGRKLVSLLSIAAEHYDQVIIDSAPVMGIADAPILAHVAAGTLLVVHSGGTKINTAQAALKRLHAARARVIGALVTRYDAKVAGYGYSYEGYYAYGGAPQLTRD